MVRIFRFQDAETAKRAGYEANYIADLTFRQQIETCGVILVDLQSNEKSDPHAHSNLEEVFVALTQIRMYIDEKKYDLQKGDVAIVSPGEFHSFETASQPGRLLALKYPNLKDDKVVPNKGNEN